MKKRWNLLKIFSVAVLMLIGNFGWAQTKVIVYQIGGEQNEYVCSENGKLTFDETNLIIDNGNGNVTNVARTNILKIIFVDESTLAISPVLITHSVTVFPNPAGDFIQIAGLDEETFLLTIVSVDGKMMLSGQYAKDEKINVSFLPKGLYIAKLNHSQVKLIKL
jgi:hypothetical protein